MIDELKRDQITRLFKGEYYNYHYLNGFFSENKVHFLAFLDDILVGYASIVIKAKLAHFTNLLVLKQFRNLSISSKLDSYRSNYCAENNLVSYCSCVMDSIHSQTLKYSNGMIPINLKYGYRFDVLYKGHLGGAITFLDKRAKIVPAKLNSIIVDYKTKRIRILASEFDTLSDYLHQVQEKHDWYIDLISSDNSILAYVNSCDFFSYQGHDICNEYLEGGMLFQIKNDRFWRGVNTKNRILFSESDICNFIKLSKVERNS